MKATVNCCWPWSRNSPPPRCASPSAPSSRRSGNTREDSTQIKPEKDQQRAHQANCQSAAEQEQRLRRSQHRHQRQSKDDSAQKSAQVRHVVDVHAEVKLVSSEPNHKVNSSKVNYVL